MNKLTLPEEFLCKCLNLHYCPCETEDGGICNGGCTNEVEIEFRNAQIAKFTAIFPKESDGTKS